MSGIKVSVIIPVFNAGKYLRLSLESVANQTLRDIEIIVINDGSTDESEKIIDSLALKDQRIKVIETSNEGASAARNKGLTIATGEFTGFVDADDWAEPGMFEKLYNAAKSGNADLAICNAITWKNDTTSGPRLKLTDVFPEFANDREKELVQLMEFKYDYANWNKIYSAAIINKYKLQFSEKLKIYEDLLFNLCFWQYTRKGVLVNDPLYNYRIHTDSIMNRKSSTILAEFNILFNEFDGICEQHRWKEARDTFQKEMRRSFYYQHLPALVSEIKSRGTALKKRISLLISELQKLNPGLFSFERAEMRGIQGIKKILLKKKKFPIFSMIEVLRGNEL